MSLVPSVPAPFELEILRDGVRYQKWVADSVRPFLGKRILEVGAGIGNLSRWLPVKELLVATEADPALYTRLERTMREEIAPELRGKVQARRVELSVPGGRAGADAEGDIAKDDAAWVKELAPLSFDTVISFNVLEHIQDDARAFAEFVRLLELSSAPGPKRIVTFVPAHSWAYGTVDRGYDHFRRYSRRDLQRIVDQCAPGAAHWMRHFNLPGLPGWIWLGQIRKQKELGRKSVLAFERIAPLVRPIDRFLGETLRIPFGQSILSVVTLSDPAA